MNIFKTQVVQHFYLNLPLIYEADRFLIKPLQIRQDPPVLETPAWSTPKLTGQICFPSLHHNSSQYIEFYFLQVSKISSHISLITLIFMQYHVAVLCSVFPIYSPLQVCLPLLIPLTVLTLIFPPLKTSLSSSMEVTGELTSLSLRIKSI